MSTLIDRVRRGLGTWRDDVDSAAADLPGVGALFARNWRILRYDQRSCQYVTADGQLLDISAEEDIEAARTEITQMGRKGPLVLRIAETLGFRREAGFPSAARQHIDDALELALPRLSPLPADDIVFAADYAALVETEGRLSLPVSIVRKDTLEAALRRAVALGLDVAAVDLEHTGMTTAPVIDLRDGRTAPSSGRSAFGLALILTLLLAVIASGLTLDRSLRLEPRLEQIQRPATLENRLQTAIEHAGIKARSGSVVAALNDLSRRLPDGAYITSFAYENGNLRLTGLAWDAAAALRALDAADEFVDAQFDGATVRDEETGRERFEMTLRHRLAAEEDAS